MTAYQSLRNNTSRNASAYSFTPSNQRCWLFWCYCSELQNINIHSSIAVLYVVIGMAAAIMHCDIAAAVYSDFKRASDCEVR